MAENEQTPQQGADSGEVMAVERDRVVSFHYTLQEQDGDMSETSRGGEPLALLYGYGHVVAGVEEALAGRIAGDRFSVLVPPAKGYGERREGNVRRVSKKHVPNAKGLKPGARTTLTTEQGQHDVTVIKVGRTVVDVDLNHPLAGRTLSFDIEIINVRAADAEEIAHGHVHGPHKGTSTEIRRQEHLWAVVQYAA